MAFDLGSLSEEQLNHLKFKMLSVCRDYEPWADFMLLSGAGDSGIGDFPLNLDEIESITFSREARQPEVQ